MVATRIFLQSPFDSSDIYIAGFDTNTAKVADTAWIVIAKDLAPSP
jgi:hypothetical protein